MREDTTWSVSLGQWISVKVRLHLFFILFAAMTLYLSWLFREQHGNLVMLATFSLLALFLSVLLHEVGHLAAELHVGGYIDTLVLGPLGGLYSHHRTHSDPRAEMIVSLAGPLMNLGCFLILLPLAMFLTPDASIGAFFNPLIPVGVGAAEAVIWKDLLRITVWINWLLFLCNLLPAFPFDGGRASRAVLLMIWPDMGRSVASQLVGKAAVVVALGLLVAAFFTESIAPMAGVAPIWFVLVLLSIALFFSAKRAFADATTTESDDQGELFGYDFSQGYTSLERSTGQQAPARPNFLRRWFDDRREQRRQREAQLAKEEEAKADEILQRLHLDGMQSLSDNDRALLDRVSRRYRSRMG